MNIQYSHSNGCEFFGLNVLFWGETWSKKIEKFKVELKLLDNFVQRTEYIEFLRRHRDKQVIKVVSGVRRFGKSTLVTSDV